MTGYKGYSMSNNAIEAYNSGERPISKWTKTDILQVLKRSDIPKSQLDLVGKMPLKSMRDYGLRRSSWHHTSSHYNKTDFYVVDVDWFAKVRPNHPAFEKSKKTIVQPERWEAEYLEWSGTRKHPKATEVRSVGELKGDWFYLPDGSKKSIKARGFRLIKKIGGRKA